ncbi:hypothetical protein HXA31_10605 [Salipaludibacillus agaradhaerens]|uniref:Bacteriocin-associated integral membrane protein n=1 Tax=Salipaludibacillus agaradhaerens TaxID=76935 RepID=A0A9Q4FYD4_SALAG|nr:hypothetical protein [Salipaludibacillus agaradhaerens]MCR6095613.1 hypothetical protein [Salipaludibacillus agaradhaerens]MCR6114827.1 hypothetical protein [Salipaludibacillus agaradhaerens]
MMNKKKLVFFSLLFFIGFTIIGDAYIYFLDGKLAESDFKYTTGIKDEALNQEYLHDLKQYGKELDLKIYVIESTVNSKNTASYIIYSTEENKDFFKKRIKVGNDETVFKSLISGNRKITFKSFDDLTTGNTEEAYYVFGEKESVELLRSKTIDKYGMSKPEENNYPNDAVFMVASAWFFLFIIVFLSVLLEVNSLRKEVLIKHLNGSEKKDIIRPLIVHNSLSIISSALIGILFAQLITESFKFPFLSCLAVSAIIIFTNSLYLSLYNMDVKKTFVKSFYTLGYKLLSLVLLFLITITLILTLTLNLKTIHDALLTMSQEEDWVEFYDYDNVFFLFKELSPHTNFDTDKIHANNFYNENLDEYQINLSFDFSNNGGVASSMTEVNESFVYLNKYAKNSLEHLAIDLNKLEEDRYYIISRYTDEELKEKNIFDPNAPNEITNLLQNHTETFETIFIESSYEVLVNDINITNLADNYKKNPIIILDTHDKFPRHLMSSYIFNSLVKFNHSNDFDTFIKEIGYENETFYKNNIKDLYLEKRNEKILILLINIILSTMILILFNLTLSTILNADFNSRSIEIALFKVLGKTLFQRYSGIFKLLIGAFISGILTAFFGKFIFHQFSIFYIFVASIIVFINTTIILFFFINKYEKISIPRVLKGGM